MASAAARASETYRLYKLSLDLAESSSMDEIADVLARKTAEIVKTTHLEVSILPSHLVMITGEYGLMALSLARRIGMLTEENNVEILTGAELDELDDNQVQPLLEREFILTRMAPKQGHLYRMALISHKSI